MKKAVAIAAFLLFVSACYATERAASLYRTHKLSIGDVMITCTDGRKPTAKVLENAPVVLVSCPLGRNQD